MALPEKTLEFAWRELFNPLGMRNVTLEFDADRHIHRLSVHVGKREGLGALWIALPERGKAGDRRILPDGWVKFSASATLATDYGAGFWTNRSDNERALERVNMGIPRDAFYA